MEILPRATSIAFSLPHHIDGMYLYMYIHICAHTSGVYVNIDIVVFQYVSVFLLHGTMLFTGCSLYPPATRTKPRKATVFTSDLSLSIAAHFRRLMIDNSTPRGQWGATLLLVQQRSCCICFYCCYRYYCCCGY